MAWLPWNGSWHEHRRQGPGAYGTRLARWCKQEAYAPRARLIAAIGRRCPDCDGGFQMSQDEFPDPGSGFVVTHFLVVSLAPGRSWDQVQWPGRLPDPPDDLRGHR
jgi:hypothetical protein